MDRASLDRLVGRREGLRGAFLLLGSNPLAIFFEDRVGSTHWSSITEGVGFEPTSPFGRQFSRLVH